jgi:hypothetical protein
MPNNERNPLDDPMASRPAMTDLICPFSMCSNEHRHCLGSECAAFYRKGNLCNFISAAYWTAGAMYEMKVSLIKYERANPLSAGQRYAREKGYEQERKGRKAKPKDDEPL